MCVCVCVCVCACVCLSVCLSVCLCVCVCIHKYIELYMYLYECQGSYHLKTPTVEISFKWWVVSLRDWHTLSRITNKRVLYIHAAVYAFIIVKVEMDKTTDSLGSEKNIQYNFWSFSIYRYKQVILIHAAFRCKELNLNVHFQSFNLILYNSTFHKGFIYFSNTNYFNNWKLYSSLKRNNTYIRNEKLMWSINGGTALWNIQQAKGKINW